MPYCSQAQFEGEFGAAELSRLLSDRPQGFAAAAAAADGEINEYLAGRYLLPLGFLPSSLLSIAADITRYRLYDEAPPEVVADRYERAQQRLRDIAAGRSVLLGADNKPLPGPGESGSLASDPYSIARPSIFGDAFDRSYLSQDPRRYPGIL